MVQGCEGTGKQGNNSNVATGKEEKCEQQFGLHPLYYSWAAEPLHLEKVLSTCSRVVCTYTWGTRASEKTNT